jgi:hypothetical protein
MASRTGMRRWPFDGHPLARVPSGHPTETRRGSAALMLDRKRACSPGQRSELNRQDGNRGMEPIR